MPSSELLRGGLGKHKPGSLNACAVVELEHFLAFSSCSLENKETELPKSFSFILNQKCGVNRLAV